MLNKRPNPAYKLRTVTVDGRKYSAYFLDGHIMTHCGVFDGARWIDWNEISDAMADLLLSAFDEIIP